METLLVYLVALGLWFGFGGLGVYVAQQKGRSPVEGAVLGFLFGPLGCLIAAMLPARQPPPPRRKRSRGPSWDPRLWDGEPADAIPEPAGGDDPTDVLFDRPPPGPPRRDGAR